MPAQWPKLVAALVDVLPYLPGWDQVTVYDGPPVTSDSPDDYVTVGWEQSQANGGDYRKTPDPDGFQFVEVGNVHGLIVCRTGDADAVSGLRERLFTYIDAFEAWVRGNQTISGVLSPRSTVDLSFIVTAVQEATGAAVGVTWTLSYDTIT